MALERRYPYYPRVFDRSWAILRDEHVPGIAREIGDTNDLEAIILVENALRGPGVRLMLPIMMNVYWINVRGNPLNDEGVDVLTELVSTSKTIKSVDFTADDCSVEALTRYMDALVSPPSLKNTLIQTTRHHDAASERALDVILKSIKLHYVIILGDPNRASPRDYHERFHYCISHSPMYRKCYRGCYLAGNSGFHGRTQPPECHCPMPEGRNNAYHEMETFLEGSRNKDRPIRKFFDECGDQALIVRILRCMIGTPRFEDFD